MTNFEYHYDSYFNDGLKTIEHFGNYVTDLSSKLHQVRQKQDEERRRLNELRQLLRSAPGLEKEVCVLCLQICLSTLRQLPSEKEQNLKALLGEANCTIRNLLINAKNFIK